MTTQAKIGHGTLLKRGDGGAPEAFTSVVELLSVKGPALSRDMKDATNMSSINQREEVIPGLLRTGTVDFDCSLIRGDVQQTGLLTDIKNGTLRNFQLVFADDPTNPVAFAAYVQKMEPNIPLDDKRTYTVSLKLSGDFSGL